jgi:hypothetical protein
MSNNQTSTTQADPKATNIQRRARRKRIHILRNSAYLVIMLVLLGVIAKFAAERILQPVPHEDVQAANSSDMGVGSISQQTDKGRCELVSSTTIRAGPSNIQSTARPMSCGMRMAFRCRPAPCAGSIRSANPSWATTAEPISPTDID